MRTVIERLCCCREEGRVMYKDIPSTFEQADKIAGRRLDRRKNYAIISGKVCEAAEWSSGCSGCSGEDPYGPDHGIGCHECGYTGRVRNSHWVEIDTAE